MEHFLEQLNTLERLFRSLLPENQNQAVFALNNVLMELNNTLQMRKQLADNANRTVTEEAELLIQERYGFQSPIPSNFEDSLLMGHFGDNDLINALYNNLPQNEIAAEFPVDLNSSVEGQEENAQLKSHIELLPFSCPSCDFCAKNRKQLWRHKSKYGHFPGKTEKSSPLKCELCDYSSKFRQNLARHRRRFHQIRLIKCRQCSRQFKEKSALESHIKYLHQVGRDNRCNECGKRFATTSNRARHFKLMHTDASRLECHQCHKRFQTAYHLKRHVSGCSLI